MFWYFTLAMSSNLPKSLLSTTTSSSGVQEPASFVKPTMSAYRMLHKHTQTDAYIDHIFTGSLAEGFLSGLTKFCVIFYWCITVIITWHLCAAVYTGCESCGSWTRSPPCWWAWIASLSPPFSAPWRCTVATPTGGAVPVAKDTERTG